MLYLNMKLTDGSLGSPFFFEETSDADIDGSDLSIEDSVSSIIILSPSAS